LEISVLSILASIFVRVVAGILTALILSALLAKKPQLTSTGAVSAAY
jgi:hypothetical protein